MASASSTSSQFSLSWLSPSTRAAEWEQLFKDHFVPIDQLPEFKLNESGRVSNSYVSPFKYWDFHLWPTYMSHPVMRLVDSTGQSGIIFHLQGRKIEPVKPNLGSPIEIAKLDTVFAIFTRSASQVKGGDRLGYAWLDSLKTDEMDYLVRGANPQGMIFCGNYRHFPLNGDQLLTFVREILRDQNRFFQLAPEKKA